jgi:hypothetical protein
MSKKPNQKADVKNPIDPAYKKDSDNRSRQIGLVKQKALKTNPKK